MTTRDRVRYEMLSRVRHFGLSHQELFPPESAAGQAFSQVALAASLIEQHTTRKLLTAKNGMHEQAVSRAAVLKQMRLVAHTARGLRPAAPPSTRTLRLPSRTSAVNVLTAARAFIEEGEAHATPLAALGLPATCLPALRAAVLSLESALGERRTGRAGVARAQAGIVAALKLGADALNTLDVVVPNALLENSEELAAWKRMRRVVGRGGRHPVASGASGVESSGSQADNSPDGPANSSASASESGASGSHGTTPSNAS